MEDATLRSKVETHLRALCEAYPDRHVGGPGNRAATGYFEQVARAAGFEVERTELPCVEWVRGTAEVTHASRMFAVHPGPYSLACDATAPLAAASTMEELESGDFRGSVLLLHGELAREQLMPKGFVFYNPESHRRAVAALEAQAPVAIMAATGCNPQLSAGSSPFPLIEDADFDIPNAYTTEAEGEALLRLVGEDVTVRIDSGRVPAVAVQPIARKRGTGEGRVVLTAHIDSKDGSPGALDNGTGVAALLGCMELLAAHRGPRTVEVVPFNGEDYYAATGQMHYLAANDGAWGDVTLAVNVDGAGLAGAVTHVSLYGVEAPVAGVVDAATRRNGFSEGPQWPQSDHSMFVMQGVPAVALTSDSAAYVASALAHTERDTVEHVDMDAVASVARFLADVVTGLTRSEKGER